MKTVICYFSGIFDEKNCLFLEMLINLMHPCNKSINFFKKQITHLKLFNGSVHSYSFEKYSIV